MFCTEGFANDAQRSIDRKGIAEDTEEVTVDVDFTIPDSNLGHGHGRRVKGTPRGTAANGRAFHVPRAGMASSFLVLKCFYGDFCLVPSVTRL